MKRIAQFFAVSPAQLEADWRRNLPDLPVPQAIRLPRRATAGSAGYDFLRRPDSRLRPERPFCCPPACARASTRAGC